MVHGKFNAVYNFPFERAVYELEPSKVTPALLHEIQKMFFTKIHKDLL